MPGAIHLLAGLNGAGKTTLAKQLAATLPAVRFSLDEWMLRLHGIRFDDEKYPGLAERCRGLIWDTAAQVVAADVDVVLDGNMWSRERRAEAAHRAAALGATLHLHHVVVSLEVAVAQAAERDDPDSHRLSAGGIAHLAELFEPPGPDEGFALHVVTRS
ncbi:AAA family ATPase [Microbacterium jejuense]|uniref:AAA family ATPase n=1 Tax=Microbacterium jejuense TaxID=1263637 RepID=UPI0031E8AF68